MGNEPSNVNYEHIVKIYKTQQSSIDGVIDFSDNRLLAAAFLEGSTSVTSTDGVIVIFDTEIFNQDIYITHSDIEATSECNYYIELEQMPLDLNQQTVATLKDIRNVGAE